MKLRQSARIVSETAAEKPAFKESMKKRRCLIPADGFYEWKKLGPKAKQAYNIGLKEDGLSAFAGLWDRWKSPENKEVLSCTILTTDANALLKDIHNRMPSPMITMPGLTQVRMIRRTSLIC